MSPVSAVILAKDSQHLVGETIKSLSFCDEIIIVDDHSLDKTIAIAKEAGAKVAIAPQEQSFSAKRNFGLSLAKFPWVLFIDSDEKVSPALAKEIVRVLNKNRYDGYYIKRQDFFLGRRLKHGETAAGRFLRLGRKDKGSWIGSVHEEWQIKGKKVFLNGIIEHRHLLTITQFLDRIQVYARMQAGDFYKLRRKESILRIFFYPFGKFILNFFWRGGFLDGFPGLVMAFMMSWHSLLVRIWLRLYWINDGQDDFNFTESI